VCCASRQSGWAGRAVNAAGPCPKYTEEGDGRSRERNVSAAVRWLKALAQELQVPVLAAVRFNRNLDTLIPARLAATSSSESLPSHDRVRGV
jgi:DnaB-like helicase C terminal domain